ncbi:MAG: ABC transporter ATP-binding protein [Rhodospirillales bacterium]|jgi:putative hydroxymethylpyrimidine transport system ATP-binding protein
MTSKTWSALGTSRQMPIQISPPSVQVLGARVAFGTVALFDGLDFDVPSGKWTCILGPSGVGKSTLLRVILGLEDGGGKTVVSCSDGLPLAPRAAFMAQRDMLFPWLSVLQNVTLGERLRGGDVNAGATRSRALNLLARVGLADAAEKLPNALSGGMRQRVALARTLMEDRPVLLMDEPFASLDAITRLRLQTLAAELLCDRTVLLVTHDPLEALRLGHRIHVLSGSPAYLDAGLEPPGNPPRSIGDPAILTMQGELLHQLDRAATA